MSNDFPHDLLMHEFGRIGYLRRNRAEIEGGSIDLSHLAEAFAAWDRVNAELHALHRALDGVVIPKTTDDVPLGEALFAREMNTARGEGLNERHATLKAAMATVAWISLSDENIVVDMLRDAARRRGDI